MKPLDTDFLETDKGQALFQQGVDLYNTVEKEQAHTVDLNGITMGYLDFGPKTGVPLIWSHGTSFTSYEILNVQAGLVDAGYRVLSIDYRGHGKTQIDVDSSEASIYHIADDIAALMAHLAIDKAVLGGLSKGGFVAAAFYDAYPDKTLGLLLEDGGSWSNFRFKEELQLGVIAPGVNDMPVDVYEQLCDMRVTYPTQKEASTLGLKALLPSAQAALTPEYLAFILSLFRQTEDDRWVFHCDVFGLLADKESQKNNKFPSPSGSGIYSTMGIMQQSQELMIPSVIFRNVNVPVHIIDPVSPTDALDVRHQNEELQALHPEWIVHEVYDYESSPHEAHFARPERFIASAKALLERVISLNVALAKP